MLSVDRVSGAAAGKPAAPRLVIDRITVNNFKSYLGKHTIGPFHTSFSAIVGPNGSGKSNVIDALMFVLGSRAKRLRQPKLGDLVHVSDDAQHVESCAVDIYFALVVDTDSGLAETVPDSSFVVGRTAFKNSRNAYHINGQQCQQGDVATLLKSHGVDLDHKRFLILQGEVELISLMKPKAGSEGEEGLLEYLEDIIGTGHFAEKIEESATSADAVNAEYSEKMLRTRHCEKELELLVEEKDMAESFLKLENAITEKKSELFQVLRYQSDAKLAKAKEAWSIAASSLAREQEKNAHQVSVVEQLESELKQKSAAHSALEREAAELQRSMKRLEHEDVALREKKSFLKKKLLSMGKSSGDSEKKHSEAERELGNLRAEKDRLEKQLVELEKSVAANQKDLHDISASLKGKTGSLQAELAQKQLEMQPWQEQLRKAQANHEIALSSMNEARKRMAADGEDLEQVTASLELGERELANAQQSKKTLTVQQRDLQKQSAQLVEQRRLAELKSEQTAKDILLLQSTIGEAREALLQHSRSVSSNSAVGALMRDAKKIGGNIYGRLGDLGVIDGKYDVAVSTASSQLHFVVVDTTDTAQKCVDYLRQHNLGRASFIILEKMRPANHPADSKHPAGVERLFDLVSPKDKLFLPAFYFALGETLVASTMDIASGIAYDGPRRHRVVTLDGKLIDTSGTMSGGGKQLQRGAMRLKKTASQEAVEERTVNEEQLAELQSLLGERQEEQKILKAMVAESAQAIASVAKELRQVELELAKAEQVLLSLPSQIKELQAQQKKAGRAGASHYDSSPLEHSLAAAAQELKRAEADMAPIAKQVALIEEKIMDAGGIKYKVQKAKLEGLQEQQSLAESRLAKVTAGMSVLEASLHDSKHAQGDRARGEEGLVEVEAELSKLDEQLEAFTLHAIDVKSRIDQCTGCMDEHREAMDDLKKTLEQHNRTLSKFRKLEFDLKVKTEELERECAECADSIHRYSQALAVLQLNDLSTRELAEFDADELKARTKKDVEALQHQVATLEGRLATIPNPNLAVLKEYSRQKAVVDELTDQLREVEQRKHCIQGQLEQLRQARLEQFMNGLRQISLHLKQLYQLLTMGGNAELELVDSLDPFSEGVMFSVMPPRKSWKAISNLSGGEKTLASLSLIFALHSFRPTPIYVMDEIDAALDFRNVSVVANYIKQRTAGAQFIVISLRNDMFELADRLVGVYKVNQQTKSVSIDPLQFAPLLQQHQ